MDKYSKEVRSFMMSRIKSSGTRPEETVRKYLFSKGLRYRKNVKILPGKPDIVFPKYKTIVFVNGCFWHGHENCRYFRLPKSNTEYWEKKISANIARDKATREALSGLGWNVLTVWECELKKDKIEGTLESLYRSVVASLPGASSVAAESADVSIAAESEPEYGSPKALLLQAMTEAGIELSSNIEERQVAGCRFFFANGNAIAACFGSSIAEEAIRQIAKMKPRFFFMRSSSLASGYNAEVLEQIFKEHSPATKLRIL